MPWSTNPQSNIPIEGTPRMVPVTPGGRPTGTTWDRNNLSQVPIENTVGIPFKPVNPQANGQGLIVGDTPYFLMNQIRRYSGAYFSNFQAVEGGYFHSGMYRIGAYMQPWAGSEGLWQFWTNLRYEPSKGRVLINENSTQATLLGRQWITNRRSSPAPIAIQQYANDPRQLMPGNYRAVYP